MDMARLTGLGRVEDDEQVIRVGMDLREVAALQDVADGQRMKAELLRQRHSLLVVTRGKVDPDETAASFEQLRHVRPCAFVDPGRRDPADVHGEA